MARDREVIPTETLFPYRNIFRRNPNIFRKQRNVFYRIRNMFRKHRKVFWRHGKIFRRIRMLVACLCPAHLERQHHCSSVRVDHAAEPTGSDHPIKIIQVLKG